ncbi:MAG: nitrogen regulation protein NR(II) [Hyphomicrobiaceae bacterium]
MSVSSRSNRGAAHSNAKKRKGADPTLDPQSHAVVAPEQKSAAGGVPAGIAATTETDAQPLSAVPSATAATAVAAVDFPATSRMVAPGARRPVEHDMLLAVLPHPVLVLGEENRIVYANAAAESFASAGLAMLKRMRLEEVVVFGCPLLALVEQVRRTGASFNEYGVEIVSQRFSGPKLVDVYGGPMPDQPDYVFLMLHHRAMALMIERQLTHRAAARSVSGMAAVLAHEIKNPLSGIRGAAQLIEPGLREEDRPLAQLICAETDRIRDLVDRMEVFGDERPINPQPINIHDVLDHVRRLTESGVGRDIHFTLDYDPSLPPVPGNRDKLVQAFLNIFKNAVEAIGENADQGRIVLQTAFRPGVRLSVPGTTARISLPLMIQIEDNGPGIPEHLQAQIFDPFVTTKTSGKGLGLALVAKIIGDHGGVIECDSEPGKTVFRVLLPMQTQGRRKAPA